MNGGLFSFTEVYALELILFIFGLNATLWDTSKINRLQSVTILHVLFSSWWIKKRFLRIQINGASVFQLIKFAYTCYIWYKNTMLTTLQLLGITTSQTITVNNCNKIDKINRTYYHLLHPASIKRSCLNVWSAYWTRRQISYSLLFITIMCTIHKWYVIGWSRFFKDIYVSMALNNYFIKVEYPWWL